jgi:putative protease
MTVTNSQGAIFAYNQGMQQVVIARETTLDDMGNICDKMPGQIEGFIHGALCVCYSGQCLMSSLIGGRSGNRGKCAQPCRLPYTLVDKDGNNLLSHVDAGQYLLSPKDMNTLDVLPRLIEAGVASYKIEGRMKRPEYVAVVTDIYRRAMDSYLAGDYHVSDEDKKNIEQIFNRDFTTAYLEKKPGRTMMSDRRPNNRGVLVGRVNQLLPADHKAVIKLDKELNIGDGLEFWVTVGGRVGTTLNRLEVNGIEAETAPAGSKVTIDVPAGIRMNDRVFRTFDAKLMTYAGKFFGEHNKTRIPVNAKVVAHLGAPMTITLTDEAGNVGKGITKFIVEKARKHPMTEDTVRKQMDRLGTSEYVLKNLILEDDPDVMVPMSEINEARRIATEALNNIRLEKFAPLRKQIKWQDSTLYEQKNHTTGKHPLLSVQVDTLVKAQDALKAGADVLIVGGDSYSLPLLKQDDYKTISQLVRGAGKKWAIATSRIVAEKQLPYYRQAFAYWQTLQPDYFLIANNGLWEMAQKTGIPLWTDYSLNTYNGQSILFWQEAGASGVTLSPELTMKQVESLVEKTPLPLECLVEGPLEMMVSEYCVEGSFLGNLQSGSCSFHCRQETFLQDRKQEHFPLKHDQFGRTHILNGHSLSMAANLEQMAKIGVHTLRIDGRSFSLDKLRELVMLYRNVLNGEEKVEENIPHTTRGHYFRGVL